MLFFLGPSQLIQAMDYLAKQKADRLISFVEDLHLLDHVEWILHVDTTFPTINSANLF